MAPPPCIALKCQTPEQSKPGPNLPGAHVARARAIRAPCRARVCVKRSRGASGVVAWLGGGRGGQPPGPSPRKFEPPRVPAPASPPRAILSRSGDAMALLGLGSSARGAPDEVHRSCSLHGPVGLGQGPKGRAPNAARSRSDVRRHQCGRSRACWHGMSAPGGCPGRPADLNQVRASSHF
jgi:hypothetical protein